MAALMDNTVLTIMSSLPATSEPTPGPNPARITLERLVEFSDIDASGNHHTSAAIRWVEAAEAVLHHRLGIADLTFGSHPRVHLQLHFRERLYFLDRIEVELRATHVGGRSVRYAFDVRRGETVAVSGTFTSVYVPRGAERAKPWPAQVRRALMEGGDRTGDA
jgi:acyl-CoA thioesterase FadM